MYYIGEIGCNHCGDFNIAKTMIYIAKKYCKLDAVKFQKRTVRSYLSEKEYNAPHPVPENSYGCSYGAHREFLEFSIEKHRELRKICKEVGIDYGCSVWDNQAALEICSINPDFIKIPSACNTNFDLIDLIFDNYKGQVHISLGMIDKLEEKQIIQHLINKGYNDRTVLYHCVSSYPVNYQNACLCEIKKLSRYSKIFLGVGFSAHHIGVNLDLAAVALGAKYIERHFTLDCKCKGTDHIASLEPNDMKKLVDSCNYVEQSLQYKNSENLIVEKKQREKLKWNREKS